MTSGLPSFPTPLPPAPPPRSPYLVLALLAIVLAGAGLAWWQQKQTHVDTGRNSDRPVADSTARAPAGERVRVRVVNTTTTRGLARRATLILRDYGYDVVDFDTDARRRRAATLIQVHTGKMELGTRVRRVLGVGTLEAQPDSLRYLDLTVLIGNDWKAPSYPLRP